jgi:serine/threonine-protein kinase
MLMTLPDARPLSEVIAEAPLEPRRAVALLSGVASALDLANSKGLLHLELSPANVLIEDGDPGRALLTDFGIAPTVSATRLGLTPEFRSPEELRNLPPEPASNVYSLACILFACLSGQPPYVKESPALVFYAHCTDRPPSLSQHCPALPEEVNYVVAKALAKEPQDRPHTATAFVRDFARAAGLQDPPPAPRRRHPPAPPRRAPEEDSQPEPPAPEPDPRPQDAREGNGAAPAVPKPAARPPARKQPASSRRSSPPPRPPSARKAGAPRHRPTVPPPWETWEAPAKPPSKPRPKRPRPAKAEASSPPPPPPPPEKTPRPDAPAPPKPNTPPPPRTKRPSPSKAQRPAATNGREPTGRGATRPTAATPPPPSKEAFAAQLAEAAPLPVPSQPAAAHDRRRSPRRARRFVIAGRGAVALGAALIVAAGVAGWLTGGSAPDTAGAAHDRAVTMRAEAAAARVRARNDWRARTETAITQLDSRRTSGRRQLARARSRLGQSRSAAALAGAFGAATRGVANAPQGIEGASDLQAALRRTERSYRRLSRAARSGRRYRRARAAVTRSEADVVRAVKRLD